MEAGRPSVNLAVSPDDEGTDERIRMLELNVNGEIHRVAAPCTVAQLLDVLGLGDQRVAVAVERSVILRSRYASEQLGDGDRVEILEAVGGG